MNIQVSRSETLEHITVHPQKYCLECKLYFTPASLESDPHAVHYTWFLPHRREDFDGWIDRIRNKDEQIWGAILDEDGVRSDPFCPSEFTVEILP
jgi:hypothetical protein